MTTVLDAVNQVTTDARERLALLMGALLEGGSIGAGPFGVGDSGTSFGPWQFHFTGPTKSGLTPQQATDPLQAARAILPSYSAAVKRVPETLWNTNPAGAAATAAYYAEQPASFYPADRIASAWSTLTGQAAPQNAALPVGLPGIPDWLDPRNLPFWNGLSDAGKAIVGAIGKPFQIIGDAVSKLIDPHTWWRVLFVIGGAGLIVIGLGILNKGTVETTIGKVAQVA